jgi:hypothetical protein
MHSWLDNFWTDGGLITWPPQFPNLTPPRFLFVGMFEEKVYAVEVQDHDDLISCTEVPAESCVYN